MWSLEAASHSEETGCPEWTEVAVDAGLAINFFFGAGRCLRAGGGDLRDYYFASWFFLFGSFILNLA